MGRNPKFKKIHNEYSINLGSLRSPILGVSSPHLVSSGSCPTLDYPIILADIIKNGSPTNLVTRWASTWTG